MNPVLILGSLVAAALLLAGSTLVYSDSQPVPVAAQPAIPEPDHCVTDVSRCPSLFTEGGAFPAADILRTEMSSAPHASEDALMRGAATSRMSGSAPGTGTDDALPAVSAGSANNAAVPATVPAEAQESEQEVGNSPDAALLPTQPYGGSPASTTVLGSDQTYDDKQQASSRSWEGDAAKPRKAVKSSADMSVKERAADRRAGKTAAGTHTGGKHSVNEEVQKKEKPARGKADTEKSTDTSRGTGNKSGQPKKLHTGTDRDSSAIVSARVHAGPVPAFLHLRLGV